jgi:hypothetical protein
MDSSEKQEKQDFAETTDRKYQLMFQKHAGKKNTGLQAQIIKPNEYKYKSITLHVLR